MTGDLGKPTLTRLDGASARRLSRALQPPFWRWPGHWTWTALLVAGAVGALVAYIR